MKGTIQSVWPDETYRFKGKIHGEDGNIYSFNSLNWLNRGIDISNITTNLSVNFELKPPNIYGNVYPTDIRFAGEVVPRSYKTNHTQGSFNEFVFVYTPAVLAKILKLAPNLNISDEKSLFRELATSYNLLEDKDFLFSQDESGNKIVCFPSGFATDDGSEILLYCTVNNKQPGKCKWYCDRIECQGKVICSVFDLINASWYEIESNLKEFIPDLNDSATEIINNIENRCKDFDRDFVALRLGQVTSIDKADELYVPTSYFLNNDESDSMDKKELYLFCTKRKGVKGYGWYYDCITYENAPIEVYNKNKWLEKWAVFENENYLSSLADQTLEEKWSFRGRDDYGILRNYLTYTFAHQLESNNVAYSEDNKYAAFNTGLPDEGSYKYLYAFFEQINKENNADYHPLYFSAKYKFRDFAVQGRNVNGKLLTSHIHPLPAPPKYFEARSATVWDLKFTANNQITIPDYDDEHILIQRCDRLPLEFYRHADSYSKRLKEILDSSDDDSEKYRNIRDYLKQKPDEEANHTYSALQNNLYTVISTAVKRLSWNWRAVVPCYNPEENIFCYLLPVCFGSRNKTDRALIASSNNINGEMVYQIHTVIPLDWAYLDARLVCRPESEWLVAD